MRVLALCVFALGVWLATGAPAQAAELRSARLSAEEVAFDAGAPLRLRLGFAGEGAQRFRIEIVKSASGRVVKGFRRALRLPEGRRGRKVLSQVWAGRTWAGQVAPAGRYAVRFRMAGETRARILGRFLFRTHLPPVTGSTGSRGWIGEFGAPRSGGRTHEGLDILAPCGRKLVAARGGRVVDVGYDPVLYGHYLRIRAFGEPYSYFYSHLIAPPPIRRGQRLRTGRFVGRVGQTGNAATTPCHLHFEIERDGRPLDPLPFLRAWAEP